MSLKLNKKKYIKYTKKELIWLNNVIVDSRTKCQTRGNHLHIYILYANSPYHKTYMEVQRMVDEGKIIMTRKQVKIKNRTLNMEVAIIPFGLGHQLSVFFEKNYILQKKVRNGFLRV